MRRQTLLKGVTTMDKTNSAILVGTALVGLLLGQSAPAAAQVQVDSPAPADVAPVARPPAAQVQVNATPPPAPEPSASPPVVINNVQSPEGVAAMRRPYGRLMASGATLFAGIYISTVLGAAIASDICSADSSLGCRDAAWPLYVPVVGPFIQMGYLSGSGVNTGRAILAIDGALQATGVAMFIAGAVLWGSASNPPTRVAKRFQLAPYSVGTGGGMLAFGRF
jgi:hypothetical protein